MCMSTLKGLPPFRDTKLTVFIWCADKTHRKIALFTHFRNCLTLPNTNPESYKVLFKCDYACNSVSGGCNMTAFAAAALHFTPKHISNQHSNNSSHESSTGAHKSNCCNLQFYNIFHFLFSTSNSVRSKMSAAGSNLQFGRTTQSHSYFVAKQQRLLWKWVDENWSAEIECCAAGIAGCVFSCLCHMSQLWLTKCAEWCCCWWWGLWCCCYRWRKADLQ